MLAKYCPPSFWDKRNNTELSIPLPNGSIIQILGADSPDSLRGPNPKGVVLDEYGDMKSEIWSGIIQPIMISNPSAWCWFVGTPKGRNDFYQKLQFAKQNTNGSWMYSVLKASKSGLISKEQLAEAERTTTQAFFQQEYEVEFLEGAAQFFRRVRQNTYEGRMLPDQTHLYQLGVDLAKYQDWTVITPFDLSTFQVHHQDRFNQIDWNLQKARIESAFLRYNRAKTVIDSTGVGDPIVEDLERQGVVVSEEDKFKFTEKSRRQLLQHLAILLEQDKIKIPNDEGLIDEIESFRYELGDTGKVKIAVPEGLYDDRVMSLALAVWGQHEKSDVVLTPPSEERRQDKESFDRYATI